MNPTIVKSATEMWIWLGDAGARAFLDGVIERISSAPKEAQAIGRRLRSGFSAEDAEARRRAFELAVSLCSAAASQWTQQIAEQASVAERPTELLKSLAEVADHLASDFYFASGAYERSNPSEGDQSPPNKAGYYADSVQLARSLCLISYPGVIHYVIQTLDFLIEVNPREIFLLISRAVESGTGGGYEFDGMAESLVVSIVNRFIAEHRAILLAEAECRRALIAILDIFVNAGWPQARQLTYGLESIFR